MSNFYAGVVRKKFTLLCESPEGSQIEIASCHDAKEANFAKHATEKILSLIEESFDMEDGFKMKIVESMESAEDIPLVQINEKPTAAN